SGLSSATTSSTASSRSPSRGFCSSRYEIRLNILGTPRFLPQGARVHGSHNRANDRAGAGMTDLFDVRSLARVTASFLVKSLARADQGHCNRRATRLACVGNPTDGVGSPTSFSAQPLSEAA